LGIDFDPAQFALAGHNPIEALRTLHGFVQHVQLRDGFSELDGTSAEVPVGQGSVPWLELLATLGETEYAGWLTAIRTQGSDKPGDIARAIAFVRRLLLGG
jgi:sugar phosphate isomerase/epimerase